MLEAGRCVETAVSGALPGWTAKEVHTALNEPEPSFECVDVLWRAGIALGAADGTSAADDPFLRRELAEARDKARTQGRVEVRAESQLEMVRTVVPSAFAAGGLPVTPQLQARLGDLAHVGDAAGVMGTALECRDAKHFLRRVRGLR